MNDDTTLERVRDVLPKLPGWCTIEKAERLVRAVRSSDETWPVLVEIGVFGGSSLIPQTLALAERGLGRIYGIDPWRTDAALESMTADANRAWWAAVPLEEILRGLRARLRELGLERLCRLIRARSEDVSEFFEPESIDLLHVDGNHSEEKSLADVEAYLPLVKRGGLIFFDDVSWTEGGERTTSRAVRRLRESCREIEPVGDCAVFVKG